MRWIGGVHPMEELQLDAHQYRFELHVDGHRDLVA